MGDHLKRFPNIPYEPGSKLLVLGMVIQPLIGNPYIGYIKPYYWVDDHPLLYGNNGSLDPSTYIYIYIVFEAISLISNYPRVAMIHRPKGLMSMLMKWSKTLDISSCQCEA